MAAIITTLGLITLLVGFRHLILALKSNHWPKVSGKITRSLIVESESRPHNYTFQVEFHYTVANQTFTSNVLSRKPLAFSSKRDSLEMYTTTFPEGREVDVYYHPDRPKQGVLIPGGSRSSWMIVSTGILLTATGIWIRQSAAL